MVLFYGGLTPLYWWDSQDKSLNSKKKIINQRINKDGELKIKNLYILKIY